MYLYLPTKIQEDLQAQELYPNGMTGTHLENIQLHYESITWKHCDGNIIHKDLWNNRAIA